MALDFMRTMNYGSGDRIKSELFQKALKRFCDLTDAYVNDKPYSDPKDRKPEDNVATAEKLWGNDA